LRPACERLLSVTGRARLDGLGTLMFAAAFLWTLVSASISGGGPDATIAALAGVGVALVIGRLSGVFGSTPAASIVTVGIVLLVAPSMPDVISGRPQSGPLGYSNANAALLLQAAVGSLIVGAAARSGALRWTVAGVAVAIGGVILWSGSYAAALLLVLPLLVIASPRVSSRMSRRIIAACAILMLVSLTSTSAMAALDGDGERGASEASLGASIVGERRMILWRAALTLMLEHPVTGVGPGRFDDEAAPARADPDARWAHNEFLQQGAETGVLGALLLIALFLYGFARLWVVADASRSTALAATSLAVLGIHACVDYVLHFPAIAIAAALLVGAATSASRGTPSPTPRRAVAAGASWADRWPD
jgi:O-antigen ligase